ncbi:hypothetical protein ABGB18_28290 [Nonomuraea sp. B12E4]|uniref:hypothetical protein n=1 Tax=Nonomuraea sp. B12E4 TaxID=3153564 RepID=UPI00325C993E
METRYTERLRFFDGQQLHAEDLDELEAVNRELRWLHNRSLHQPGIGAGLAVHGPAGAGHVLVQEGYALDASGHEIVLTGPERLPVPPVAGEETCGPAYFDLTVSYPADEELEEAETREGACAPRGIVRLRERPAFTWVRLKHDVSGTLRPVDPRHRADIQAGMMIILARARIRECVLAADVSLAQRRTSRVADRPRIRCDTSYAEWTWWSVPAGTESVIQGVEAVIDTEAACFAQVPCYSARVAGRRPLTVEYDDDAVVTVFDGPAHVEEPATTSFRCRVPLLSPDYGVGDAGIEAILTAVRAEWAVTWLGIEC